MSPRVQGGGRVQGGQGQVPFSAPLLTSPRGADRRQPGDREPGARAPPPPFARDPGTRTQGASRGAARAAAAGLQGPAGTSRGRAPPPVLAPPRTAPRAPPAARPAASARQPGRASCGSIGGGALGLGAPEHPRAQRKPRPFSPWPWAPPGAPLTWGRASVPQAWPGTGARGQAPGPSVATGATPSAPCLRAPGGVASPWAAPSAGCSALSPCSSGKGETWDREVFAPGDGARCPAFWPLTLAPSPPPQPSRGAGAGGQAVRWVTVWGSDAPSVCVSFRVDTVPSAEGTAEVGWGPGWAAPLRGMAPNEVRGWRLFFSEHREFAVLAGGRVCGDRRVCPVL